MSVLQAIDLTKIYGGNAAALTALDHLSFAVEPGEFVGIMGPSGSGKSTLLQLLGTIDLPTSGQILMQGAPLKGLKGESLARFRRQKLGFIFQEYNLLDSLTLRENILVTLALERVNPTEMARRVEAVGARLGISEVLERYPYEVSGGQRQRAAAARALIHNPALILADEPTGALDSKSAKALMASIQELNQQDGATILMVTHDPLTASYCSRILFLKDGRIWNELRSGGDRGSFYQEILDVVAAMGGDALEPAPLRR
jgi:putative ABC transport system ATP-binding protein